MDAASYRLCGMPLSRLVMHASLKFRKQGTTKSAVGLSYMTSTFNDGRLVQITDSLHKPTLCREGVSSCLSFHPNLHSTGTAGPHSWICICIADEKM